MATGNVTVRLNLNSTGYSASMTKAQAQMKALAASTTAMGHGTVSSMQASSAAIRVLEGGMTGNIRAAERFIGMLPGVGNALKAAFPVVGAIALAGVFVKIGSEAAKAIETVLKMPVAITNGFRALNIAGQTANDTLALTNDRLRNEIARLEGKPQNNLAIAIDETRIAADKLAESLDRDNSKIAEMLSQHKISAGMGLMTGRAGTADVSGSINSYDQKLSDLGAQRNLAVHGGDAAGAAQLSKAIDDARQSALAWAASQIQQRSNQGPGGLNQDANLGLLRGYQTTLLTQGDQEGLENSNSQLQAQKDKLQAARDLAASQKQAQELLVQQWRKDIDEAKADNDMTVAQEAQFWVRRMEATRTGSLSYQAALDEANRLIAQMRKGNMAGQAGLDAAGSGQMDRFDLSRGDSGQLREQGAGAVDYLRNLQEQISLQHQNATALAEASLQMAVATGQMSRLDAAQIQAAMHTQEFEQAQQRLQAALANAANLPPGFARDTAIAGLNAQGTQMQGQRQIQVMQDQQGIASNSIGPAMRQALDEMVSSWKNMAQELSRTLTASVSSFNDDIVKAMTGHGKAADFGKTFTSAGNSLLKSGLQSAEGGILGMFGIGKGKGQLGSSAMNPMWVTMTGGVAPGGAAGGSMGGVLGGVLGHIPGVGSVMQGGVGNFFSSFLPHFADGGDVLANRPIMVGERGPEPFIPRSAGTILPNSALGGSGDTHFNIDARGSTDPSAVNAAVMRAAPHLVSASMQAQHQNKRRMPQGR